MGTKSDVVDYGFGQMGSGLLTTAATSLFAPKGKVVHHKDGNKSNNSKSNVRVISKAEHNKVHPEKGGRRKCKSGFTWSKRTKACVRL